MPCLICYLFRQRNKTKAKGRKVVGRNYLSNQQTRLLTTPGGKVERVGYSYGSVAKIFPLLSVVIPILQIGVSLGNGFYS